MKPIGVLLTVLLMLALPAQAVRIKDIVEIDGVRRNPLVGYGLVVGLDGTGDGKKAAFTIQSMTSMLEKMGMTINTGSIAIDNVAAVMITGELPPFARIGNRIDVLVSSIGDAQSLQGGTLLFSPLRAADGQVYAVAQGPVSTGSFSAAGAGGAAKKNFPTVGRIAGGASVEREIEYRFDQIKTLSLLLNSPDFTTASRVAEAINTEFYDRVARTLDAGTIEVDIPEAYSKHIVGLVTRIEGLEVTPDTVATVVINERTGTVVMGDNVRISTIAIAHGNLSIEIKEAAEVSQPQPFSQGQTVVIPDSDIWMREEKSSLFLMNSGVSIAEIVKALNALGVSPRDLITIFQAIKAAGALQAKLEIM